jgi:hypothetical protein
VEAGDALEMGRVKGSYNAFALRLVGLPSVLPVIGLALVGR